MKSFKQILFVLATVIASYFTANSQCGPLSTPSFTNNGQSGIMFDVVAITPVEITQLGMDYDNGTYNLEVYSIPGTHVGNETNAAAWTLLGTVNGWTGTSGSNNIIPVTFSHVLCPGESVGFYVTASNSTGGNYSNGTGVGNVAAADANIQILEGTGKAHPFANSYTPRVPNVTVYYNCLAACCTPPTMSMTQESCAGACDGTATATVGAGGIPPYTYQWDAAAGSQTTQTATGLCAGTYTVSVTDGTGCVANGTVTVTSAGVAADPTITPAGPFCESDPPTNLTAVDPGGTWSGTGITDAVNGTFDPSVAGPGTHTITYTIGGSCGGSDTETIIVNPDADATITPVGPFCEVDPALNLTAVDPGGTWSGTGITDPVNGTFDPLTAGSGTHTITYTIGGLCGDVQTTNITVNAQFDATINASGPYCESDPSVNLTAVDPGGTWSGTGIIDAANGTFDPATAGAGTYTITYTIGGSCGSTDTESFTVNPDADATITQVGPYCEADPALNLSAVDPGGSWSGNGITDAVNGTFDPAIAGPGTHTITYTIGGQCGDVQTIDIVVNNLLDATITPAGPVCELDAAFNLTAVDPGGTWSGNGITDAVNGTFDPGVAGAGTHTITYTIGGACGDTQTTDIVVDPALDATITPVGPFCEADPALNLNAVDPGGTWSGNGITDPVNGTFDPATAGVGTHTITYTIPGACGDSQTTDITINSTSDATITPAGPFCEADPAYNLAAVDPGGTWSGNGITDAVNGTFDPAVAGAGTHTITYSISGICGDTQTTDIVVNSMDDATITPLGPVCLGSVNNLTAVTGGGTWSGTGITDPVNGTFDASAAGPGIHTITYTTNGPCPDVATTDIEVLPPLDLQASASTSSICDGDVVNLSATGSGGDGNLTYTWTDQTGAVVGTGANISVTPSVTTTYTVTLSDGCSSPIKTFDILVTVYPIPTINIIADNQLGCAPLDVNFTNLSNPQGTNCTWSFGNGTSDNSCGATYAQYTSPGCYDVTLTVEENGCSNSETLDDFICVADEPVANFNFSPEQGTNFDTEFEFFNMSLNAESYSWDFDDGSTSTEENPTHYYAEEPGGYFVCLIASNSYGCADTLCRPLSIVEEIIYFVPNSFTPDGDEFNQSFKPVFVSGYDPYNFTFRIFNRWGEQIWESHDPSVGWDGTYGNDGKLVETGVYVWKVEFKYPNNDDKVMDTGHVNVLR